jgi:hypothetical protein
MSLPTMLCLPMRRMRASGWAHSAGVTKLFTQSPTAVEDSSHVCCPLQEKLPMLPVEPVQEELALHEPLPMVPVESAHASKPAHELSPMLLCELAHELLPMSHELSPMLPVVNSHEKSPIHELSPMLPVAPVHASTPMQDVTGGGPSGWTTGSGGAATLASAPVGPSKLSRRRLIERHLSGHRAGPSQSNRRIEVDREHLAALRHIESVQVQRDGVLGLPIL